MPLLAYMPRQAAPSVRPRQDKLFWQYGQDLGGEADTPSVGRGDEGFQVGFVARPKLPQME
jgi:hypothetical protein